VSCSLFVDIAPTWSLILAALQAGDVLTKHWVTSEMQTFRRCRKRTQATEESGDALLWPKADIAFIGA
jgi:hypothetical protein